MASAAQTIGDDGGEFEADTTPQVCTLTTPGGRVRNTSAAQAVVIAINKAIASASQPGGVGVLRILAGASVDLPRGCMTFGFMASASGFIQVEKKNTGNI